MDLDENNFRILGEYLKGTLSPDPAVRRPGKRKNFFTLQKIANFIMLRNFSRTISQYGR